jgi:hypothetical protein
MSKATPLLSLITALNTIIALGTISLMAYRLHALYARKVEQEERAGRKTKREEEEEDEERAGRKIKANREEQDLRWMVEKMVRGREFKEGGGRGLRVRASMGMGCGR